MCLKLLLNYQTKKGSNLLLLLVFFLPFYAKLCLGRSHLLKNRPSILYMLLIIAPRGQLKGEHNQQKRSCLAQLSHPADKSQDFKRTLMWPDPSQVKTDLFSINVLKWYLYKIWIWGCWIICTAVLSVCFAMWHLSTVQYLIYSGLLNVWVLNQLDCTTNCKFTSFISPNWLLPESFGTRPTNILENDILLVVEVFGFFFNKEPWSVF